MTVIVTNLAWFFLIVDYITSRDTSLSLYTFLCHHIVGSEETVKTKRTFNSIKDNLEYGMLFTTITRTEYIEIIDQDDVHFSFAKI